MGAAMMIGVEANPERAAMALVVGADRVMEFTKADPVSEITRLTVARGVDVAIKALGRQETIEAVLRVLRPGRTLSFLGVYSTDLWIPVEPFANGIGDYRVVTTLVLAGRSACVG